MIAATKPQAPMAQPLAYHRFTFEEYLAMAEHGILRDDARVELLAGEIVDMSPIGLRHTASITHLLRTLLAALGNRATIQCQSTLWLTGDFAPEPDIAVLAPREDCYAGSAPGAADIRLIIEVADTSLQYDRTTKRRLYAKAGIAEYWIVDLNDRRIEVYAEPNAAGEYARQRVVEPGEQLAPRAFPDIALDTAAILRF